MITTAISESDAPSIGQKLLAHSKSADFTARRGLVVDLFPFLFGASQRMSSRAISDFLSKEQGVKLSGVTINKALKDPRKNWNLFFDEIEPAARIFEKDDRVPMKDFLFVKEYFWKPAKNPLLKATVKMLVSEEIAYAANILRHKWFNIDWEVRLKARPFLEHRFGGKAK